MKLFTDAFENGLNRSLAIITHHFKKKRGEAKKGKRWRERRRSGDSTSFREVICRKKRGRGKGKRRSKKEQMQRKRKRRGQDNITR